MISDLHIPIPGDRAAWYLTRARFAEAQREPIYVTGIEMDELTASVPLDRRPQPPVWVKVGDAPLPAAPTMSTLYGVPLQVGDDLAAGQLARMQGSPEPRRLDWET